MVNNRGNGIAVKATMVFLLLVLALSSFAGAYEKCIARCSKLWLDLCPNAAARIHQLADKWCDKHDPTDACYKRAINEEKRNLEICTSELSACLAKCIKKE